MTTMINALPLGMEFDFHGNIRYQKSWYQVYECLDTTDPFSYGHTKVLFESDNLGQAHSYAYNTWLEDESKAYTIIQPYDESCRGGYGDWVEQGE